MSDKVILKDFTTLAVCPSEKWSTIERRAIFDCIYLRNIGGNPYLLCIKDSQLDIEAEKEDIPKIYIDKYKITAYKDFQFIMEFKNLLKENRYDIVHCYDLSTLWISSFLMKSNQVTPLFLTLNQNIKNVYHHMLAKWMLKRVDCIFTLSKEISDFVEESFSISPSRIKNLGSGIDTYKTNHTRTSPHLIGCVIDNMNELKRLNHIVKVFRFLKTHSELDLKELTLSVFLGPRIYQEDKAKKYLTEFEHEFYQGDILLYNLDHKYEEFKKLDILIGVAFDEPLNDYEVIALIHEIPVLFPRTAMRQSLIHKFSRIGESYVQGDIREAKSKIEKILKGYPDYINALKLHSSKILGTHGVDYYADEFEKIYQLNYAKRHRFSKNRKRSA